MNYLYSLGISFGIVAFVFYAGRRYERGEWELVSWENSKLRTDNAELREQNEELSCTNTALSIYANDKATENARLRQSLLSKFRLFTRGSRN